jgi:Family of unknown function (DUF6152)
MRTAPAATLFALVSFTVAGPLLAHHSMRATFDDSKVVKVTGVVTRIDWANPHVVFYLNVKDDIGATSSWILQMSTPRNLAASGVEKNFFKIGDPVSAEQPRVYR